MREPVVLFTGHVLVKDGLCEKTRRAIDNPRDWQGLTGSDAAILWSWADGRRGEILELHTDVELGSVPSWVFSIEDPALRRQACSAHPLRADAVVLLTGGWILLEVKPNAGYQALGQVLTYLFYAPVCCEVLVGCSAGVVTNAVQPCIAPVYAHHGVEIFEVGEVVTIE